MSDKIYDVFISFSTADQKTVEGICGFLERYGYRCFVSYRDIPPSAPWPAAIPPAIKGSSLMVVVFSKDFNVSTETDKELTIASKNNIPILTFKLSDTEMSGSKEYFLTNLNWIDAFPNPENYFGKLKESIEKLIGKPQREYLADKEIHKRQEVKKKQQEDEELDRLRSALLGGQVVKIKTPQPPVPKRREWVKRYIWVIAILLLLVALAVMLIKGGKPTPEPVAPVETLQQSSAEPSQDDQVISVLSSLNTKQGQEAPAQQSSSKMCVRQEKENLFFVVNGVEFKMVKVEGGTFWMGATQNEDEEASVDESPRHKVTLSDYYICETEVTQGLWKAVMGSEPTYNGGWTKEYGKGENYPAYMVSYDDVDEFVKKLNRETGRTFRLPTEAEWEYAARGGNRSKGYKYSGSDSIDEVAWHDGNSGGKTHPVKGKRANELGLYNMSGNVWEWCADWFEYYSRGEQDNPQGPDSGADRVCRGACWSNDASYCRVSKRNYNTPACRFSGLGFRLVLCP